MRKLFITFALAMFASLAFAGNNSINLKTGLSAHDYPLDNGFILRAGIGITMADYGAPDGYSDEDLEFYNDEIRPKITLGLEIGNQWYVWRQSDETMGVAINVNWFDFSYGVRSTDAVTNITINAALLEFGPLYTYAVNDDIGIDAFFNFRPTLFSQARAYENDDADADAEVGFGLTYAIGANMRWRALLVGLELGFGKVKVASTEDADNDFAGEELDNKVKTGVFKINIGVKL